MSGLIVAGMHRSGTSVMGATLAALGWHPGEELVHPADPLDGEYFEDAAFVALHRRWLDAATPPGAGHRDWGVAAGGPPDPASVEHLAAEARAFAARRDGERSRWMAKDPRATWFLPQWAVAVPDARFVLVYRAPWDVVDSMVRLATGPWIDDPGDARRIWQAHNEALLRFVDLAGDRAVLVAGEAVVARPDEVATAVSRLTGVSVVAPSGVVDAARFVRRDLAHPVAGMYADLFPDLIDLLGRLDERATVGRPEPARRPSRRPLAGGTLPTGVGVQVLVPCRNDGRFLDESLASVQAAMDHLAAEGDPLADQVEVTVVDDGSSDPETLRIMDRLRATGWHVHRTEGVGLAAARNAGVALSATAAVLPLDSDNRLEPALLRGTRAVVSGAADVVHGPWEEFGQRSRVVRPPAASLGSLYPHNSIDNCAVISRRMLDRLGGWSTGLAAFEDWDLWLRCLARGARFQLLDEVTFRYLVRGDGMLGRLNRDADRSEQLMDVVRRRNRRRLGLTRFSRWRGRRARGRAPR